MKNFFSFVKYFTISFCISFMVTLAVLVGLTFIV